MERTARAEIEGDDDLADDTPSDRESVRDLDRREVVGSRHFRGDRAFEQAQSRRHRNGQIQILDRHGEFDPSEQVELGVRDRSDRPTHRHWSARRLTQGGRPGRDGLACLGWGCGAQRTEDGGDDDCGHVHKQGNRLEPERTAEAASDNAEHAADVNMPVT